MMNPTEDLLLANNENKDNFCVRASEICTAQLKLQFKDILFNPKCTTGADHLSKSSNKSVSLSASVIDSSSVTLHYEDFKGHHAVFSEERIQSLRRIAEMLSSRNDLEDCVQMYIGHRKDVVNMVHMRLREKLDIGTICIFTYLDDTSDKIQRWIQVANICMGTIFETEKCFYGQIFGDLGTVEGTAACGFVYIVREAAADLFNFPNSLLASQRLPKRPDILLPLYQELINLFSNVIAFFNQNLDPATAIRNYATKILLKLKQHMANVLPATERYVLNELSMIPTPGGAIHPLNQYVIHYIDQISVHIPSLIDLVAIPNGSSGLNPPEIGSLEINKGLISLEDHLTRVIEFLLYNLRHKSHFCGQQSLGYLFMMNNINSVAEKIKSSVVLKELIGGHFLIKLRKKVKLTRTDYLNATWGVVCLFLRDEGSKSNLKCNFFPGRSTRAIRKKFKTFSHMFDDIHHTQSKWMVPDQQLREKLLGCILTKLIPAYNHFLAQFSSQIEKMKHPNRYIKYSVKDLETKVLNMFQCTEDLNIHPSV